MNYWDFAWAVSVVAVCIATYHSIDRVCYHKEVMAGRRDPDGLKMNPEPEPDLNVEITDSQKGG